MSGSGPIVAQCRQREYDIGHAWPTPGARASVCQHLYLTGDQGEMYNVSLVSRLRPCGWLMKGWAAACSTGLCRTGRRERRLYQLRIDLKWIVKCSKELI
jgi:hypothetical protein